MGNEVIEAEVITAVKAAKAHETGASGGAANELKESLKAWTAGTAAGVFSKIIEYPFDTVKVKLQTAAPGSFGGPIDCIRTTVRTQGVQGLYQGLTAPLLAAMLENAISFTVYSRVQARVQTDISAPTIGGTMIAGGAAGLGTATLLTPVELIKCRLQVQERGRVVYRGPLDCVRQTFRSEGVRAFFTGHTATLVREVPGGMAYFGAYEAFCKLFTPEGKKKDDLHPVKLALAGSTGGVAYWSLFFPADTIKSRLQTEQAMWIAANQTAAGTAAAGTGGAAGAASGPPKSSFSSMARDMVRTGGVKSLYRGLGITLARAVPSNFVTFFAYEAVMRRLKHL